MVVFSLKILDQNGHTKFVDSAENLVSLVVTSEYVEGDRIVLESSEKDIHVWLQIDDALGDSLIYLTGNMDYTIPFGEKRVNMSPKVFSGKDRKSVV